MGDFMDVPDFDGPGVFARATDAAWLAHGQTQARGSPRSRASAPRDAD